MVSPSQFKLTVLAQLCALALATPVQAQDQVDDKSLEVIVVSSQKIKQTKHDVPGALATYTDTMMEEFNIDSVADIALITAGVNYQTPDNHTTYFVYRGIGGTTTMNKIYNINIDGVTIPYVDPNIGLDVDMVEVIKGGQGALYGRSTLGGLLKVNTRRPSENFEGYVQAEYASYNTYGIKAALGGGLGSHSAARIAIEYQSTDSYFENTTLDRDDSNDNEQFSAHAKFDIYKTADTRVSFDIIADSYDGGFDNFAVGGGTTTTSNEPGYTEGDLTTGIFTVEKQLTAGKTLTSITSYTDSSYGFLQDWDFSPMDINSASFDESTQSLSEELRLHGKTHGGIDWLAAAFLMREELDTATLVNMGADAGPYAGAKMYQNSTVKTLNAALFGQAILPVGQFELTGRMRLDYDKKSLDWQNGNNVGMPTSTLSYDDDWLALLPSVSIGWKPSPQRHSYLSASRGYKAGDYNNVMVEPQVVTNALDPEYSITYELGHKEKLGHGVEIAAAIYYIDWTDIQIDVPHPEYQGSYLKQNAAEAHSSGIELELHANLTAQLFTFVNANYLFNYTFDDFANGVGGDYTGNKLPYTNEYSVSFGASYSQDRGLFASADLTFYSAQFMNEANTIEEDNYGVLNTRLGYRADSWSAYIYANNLSDEAYSISMFNNAKLAAPPRVVGLKTEITF